MDEGRPVISVIVPVYNVEPYIGRCLDSIAAQTYTDIEVILVDDASTDKSAEICQAYGSADQRVRVIRLPENRGPSAARNEGVRRAKGEFVSFVDADDYIEPEYLERLYECLRESGGDVSICGAEGLAVQDGPAHVYSGREAVCCLAKDVPFSRVPWGKLYSLRVLKKVPFEEDIFYSEDLLFLYWVFQETEKVGYFPDRLYHYVQREGSQVQSGFSERKCTALIVHDTICRDAAVHFPEAAPYFCRLVLDVNARLAMQAVESRVTQGLFECLKSIRKSTRRNFRWKAFWLLEKKSMAAVLLLYLGIPAFWGMAAVYGRVKRVRNRWT